MPATIIISVSDLPQPHSEMRRDLDLVRQLLPEVVKRPGLHWPLDWASFENIVETSDTEPPVSVGIEQQAMFAGPIRIAVLP